MTAASRAALARALPLARPALRRTPVSPLFPSPRSTPHLPRAPPFLFAACQLSTSAGKRDYYEVLGATKDATQAELKKKFVVLAKKWHPDQNKDNKDAAKKFQEVAEAWEVLGDEEKRKKYDAYGHQGVDGPAGSPGGNPFGNMGGAGNPFGQMNVRDLFDLFGSGMGGGSFRDEEPATIRMSVSMLEALKGASKSVTYRGLVKCHPCKGTGVAGAAAPVNKPCHYCKGQGSVTQRMPGLGSFLSQCPACHGAKTELSNACLSCQGEGRVEGQRTVKVDVPPGVDRGTMVNFSQQGNAGRKGAGFGDLIVQFDVERLPGFERDGQDVHSVLPINFVDAILGSVKTTKTMDSEVELKIPPGTQPGQQLRLSRKGFPQLGRTASTRGDHLITIKIEMPDPNKLTPRQRELLKEFQDAGGASSSASAAAGGKKSEPTKSSSDEDKGLFGRLKEKLTGS